MKAPSIQEYVMKFSVSVPSMANIMVLYGGKFMDDPQFAQRVRLGELKPSELMRFQETFFFLVSNVFPCIYMFGS
jgi:hypothetical protein